MVDNMAKTNTIFEQTDEAPNSRPSQVCVAVTQAEPVWLDLQATIEKTCHLIREAASNGAQLITFPECWVPGYPAWIWARPVDMVLSTEYIRNSLRLGSPQIARVQRCAAENDIVVVLGASENRHDSLYISQIVIGADGQILTTRTKLKATHMERTIFGDASGDCLDGVVQTSIGRIGALSCWEHVQPLLKYHMCSGREQIHIAAWPPLFSHTGGDELWSMSREGTESIARMYAIEAQCFVLHTTAVISQAGIDKMRTENGIIMTTPGGGCSAIFGPDGRKLSQDITDTEEGIIYATLELGDILKAKAFLDICGHYSRPDMLWLGIDKEKKLHVRSTV